MAVMKDYESNTLPGNPVLAVFIDADGKIVAVSGLEPDLVIPGLRNQLDTVAGPGDPAGPTLEVEVKTTNHPPDDGSVRVVTSARLRVCYDQFRNPIRCPRGS